MDRVKLATYKPRNGRKADVASWAVESFMLDFAPSPDLPDSLAQRQTMVDCQIRTFDVTDQLVIRRFLSIPRERFMPNALRGLAYSDTGFTVAPEGMPGEGRYILPPFVLARLIQGGRVSEGDRVLDVAGGYGYSAAILSGLTADVVSLEGEAAMSATMEARLAAAGFDRVRTVVGPIAEGAAALGPFDIILVNGAAETGLEPLFGQLARGGRLLVIQRTANDPTGRAAKAVCYEKTGEKSGSEVSGRILFDSCAPVLPAFRKKPAFVF